MTRPPGVHAYTELGYRSALLASTPAGAIAAFLPAVDPPDEAGSERALFVLLLRTRRLAIERATVRVEAEQARARKAGEPVFYVTREDAALVRGGAGR